MRNNTSNFQESPTEEEVMSALAYLDSSCDREFWVRMGMAIKSEFGEAGFSLWDEWSQGSSSYDKAACRSSWRSIKRAGSGKSVSIATLFLEARNNGWTPAKKQFSEHEQAARIALAEKRKRQREIEEAKEQERVALFRQAYCDAFEAIWPDLLQPFTQSEYVKRKGIQGRTMASPVQPFVMLTDIDRIKISVITGRDNIHNIFQSDEYNDKNRYFKRYIKYGTVLIPLRDLDGRIYNAQVIQENGQKFFFKEAPTSGLFHVIGDPETQGVNAVCEGYATGETINLATGWPVFVAFMAHNLLPVSRKIKTTYQPSKLVVCGDDDAHSKENAGRKAATKVVRELGAISVFPSFKRQEA